MDAAISFLFSIDEIRIYFGKNKNIDFQSFRAIIMKKVGQNFKNMKTYEQIFSELFSSFDSNNLLHKDYYNQSDQYDEEKGRKNFFEKHKKGNIIQKMFFIPTEEIIHCNQCFMNQFSFDYSKFILLKNSQFNLQPLLFGRETETKKGKYCSFCNGQTTILTIKKKYLKLPEWLIVIVEPSQIKNLMINSFLYIYNGNNIVYTLLKFIEAKTNSLYFMNMNKEFCNRFEHIKFYDNEKVIDKKPEVLFYYLIQDCNNMNLLKNYSNSQNISNQNNIQKYVNNMNKQNIQQQNMNLQNNTQNFNNNINQQSNNIFNNNQHYMKQKINQQNNINQSNMNQQNNGQNFIQQNITFQQNIRNGQNMNMNNGFNNNFAQDNNNILVPKMNIMVIYEYLIKVSL